MPNISVVDDHELFRRSLCQLLGALGYPVKAYGSAMEFLDSCAAQTTDCLILDVSMPDMDGLTLQKRLAESFPRLPIIFCSGSDDAVAKAVALASGASAFLRKPVKGEILSKAIQTACRASAAKLVSRS